jgi:hypothetical protein
MVIGTYTGDGAAGGTSNGVRNLYKTTDAGAHWTNISADAPPSGGQYNCASTWWGNFAWDPIHNTLYTTAISNPTYKKQLSPVNVVRDSKSLGSIERFSVSAIRAGALEIKTSASGKVSIYDAAGNLVYACFAGPASVRTISVSAAGVYLVKFASQGIEETRNIIIK